MEDITNILDDLTNKLVLFLNNHTYVNLWIYNPEVKVYVRQATCLTYEGKFTSSLVIANIIVSEEFQRRGIFSHFMRIAHELNPYELTYLEYVKNKHLQQWCRKHGWKLDMTKDAHFAGNWLKAKKPKITWEDLVEMQTNNRRSPNIIDGYPYPLLCYPEHALAQDDTGSEAEEILASPHPS